MKLKDVFRVKISIPKFVVILAFCTLVLSFCFSEVNAEHWDGCGCPYPGTIEPQTWVFAGESSCDGVHFVWCANCEPDLAGYEIEYKIVPTEPTGLIGPDDYRNPWSGVGITEGDSPIKVWNPGMRPTGETGGIVLTDKDRPEAILNGLLLGRYYVFVLRAVDTEGFKSDHSDENSLFTVTSGPETPQDLIIKF